MGACVFHGSLHVKGRNGIGFIEVGADQHDGFGPGHVLIANRPSMRTLHAPEGPHAVDVPVPCAAVNLVRPDHDAHKFLEQVQVLVGTASRDETADRIGAVLGFNSRELPGHAVQGFLPRDFGKGAVGPAHERMPDPIRVDRGVVPEIAANAEIPVVPAGAQSRIDFDQLIVLALDRNLASVSAIGTNGLCPLEHPRTIVVHRQPAGNGPDRANLDTPAAHVAFEFITGPMRNLRERTAPVGRQCLGVNHFVAIPHATHARHATVHLGFNDRAEVLFGKDPLQFLEPADGGCVFVRKILQVAAAALVAHRTIERMIAQQQLQHPLPRRLDVRHR